MQAQALHVTPSAVSQTLAKLEREAGLPLLVRGGRRLGFTETGLALTERGERIAAEPAGARHDLAAEEPATEWLRSGTVDILVIERDGTDRRPGQAPGRTTRAVVRRPHGRGTAPARDRDTTARP